MKKSTKKASGKGAKRVIRTYSDERPVARNSLILRLKLSREAGTLSKVMGLH